MLRHALILGIALSAFASAPAARAGSVRDAFLAGGARAERSYPTPFYRIIDGPNPGPAQVARDRFLYGAEMLYTGDAQGRGVVRVKGTVWHPSIKDARSFIGDHNPVIERQELMRALNDNKWEEAKLLRKHVPDAIPRTENMAAVLAELRADLDAVGRASPEARASALRALSDALKHRYPGGFFLKPVDGFNSAGTFVTEKTDMAAMLDGYLRRVKPAKEGLAAQGMDSDDIHYQLREDEFYPGRVVERLFADPEGVIIQAKIRPATGVGMAVEEYRVHVAEGNVVLDSTQNRWADSLGRTSAKVAEAEAFVQGILDRLPPDARGLCYALDVMRADDGSFKIIELNAGGESGYLHPDNNVLATNRLSAHYLGKPTPILRAFEAFKLAPTLERKNAILMALLHRPELAELVGEFYPMSELLVRAKDAYMDALRSSHQPDAALSTALIIDKFRMQPLYAREDLTYLASRLESEGVPGQHIKALLQGPSESAGISDLLRDDELLLSNLFRQRARPTAAELPRMFREAPAEAIVERFLRNFLRR